MQSTVITSRGSASRAATLAACLSLVLLLLLAPAFVAAQPKPVLVVTIKPLALLAEQLLAPEVRVSTLLPAQASPHDFELRPSQRIDIASAGVLLRVGPSLEEGVADDWGRLAENKLDLTLLEVPGIELLQRPDGGVDPHLWLSSANAAVIGRLLVDSFSDRLPASAATFNRRLSGLLTSLDSFHASAEDLAVYENIPFAVYHNAFAYFEREHELRHSVELLGDPEAGPSPREMLRVQQQIAIEQPTCLLAEPGADRRLMETAFANRAFTLVEVDLMAANIEGAGGEDNGENSGESPSGEQRGFVGMLQAVRNSFIQCLSEG